LGWVIESTEEGKARRRAEGRFRLVMAIPEENECSAS
jgi:hypothetical protein